MGFLDRLAPAEYKRLRFLFIECILATDLKMHFGMLAEFKNKVWTLWRERRAHTHTHTPVDVLVM